MSPKSSAPPDDASSDQDRDESIDVGALRASSSDYDFQDTNADRDKAVRKGLMRMFMRNQPPTLASNLGVAPIYAGAIWFATDRLDIFWWVAALYVVTFGRIFITWHLRRIGDVSAWPDWAERALLIGALVSGIGWGAGVIWATDPSSPVLVGVSSFFVAGMISGATVSLSSIIRVFIAFAVPFVLPFAVMVLAFGGTIGAAMALSLFVYTGAMCLVSFKLNGQIREMLILRWTNNALLAEVTEERDRAEIANRVKSDFLARMSHELRTPLNAIVGFSELLRSGHYRDEGLDVYEDFAGEINRSGHHLLELVEDLLDISKIESRKVDLEDQPVALKGIVEFASGMHASKAAESGVTMEVKAVDPGLTLRVNERALRQMLINLVSNAVKFTPAGGRVDVQAEAGEDGAILISVKDTGIGIPKDKLAEVRQPFLQLEAPFTRQFAGIGLGLAIVASLAAYYGARFNLESELGEGTTATILFPGERTIPVAGDALA